jgi:peptidoglycan/LPS O-acetylase OafA/YrhL
VVVVAHHLPLFGRGAWGVDLFFVISGFIMCYVTAGGSHQFLTRRFIRVVPLYWAGTFGVAILAGFFPGFLDSGPSDAGAVLKSLFIIPFDMHGETRPLHQPGWTLNYEILFYGLFAMSMALSHRYRALVCTMLLGTLALAGYWFAWQSVPLRFWSSALILEFALGMFCYAVFRRWQAPVSGAARIAWLLLAGGAVQWVHMHPVVNSDPDRLYSWGLPMMLVFVGVVRALQGLRLPRLGVRLGDASYSLYLFHPYILHVVNRLCGRFDTPTLAHYAIAVFAVLLCCVVALLCYQHLERPFTQWLRVRLLNSRCERQEVKAGVVPNELPP